MHEAEVQIGIAGLVVYGLQFLKKAESVKWITQEKANAARWISAAAAFFTAIGLTATIDGGLTTGGKLVIAFPSIWTMINLATHGGFQFMGQELGYSVLSIRDALSEMKAGGMVLTNSGQFKVPEASKP